MPHVSAVGPSTLSLRLLDGFCLYKEGASGLRKLMGCTCWRKVRG